MDYQDIEHLAEEYRRIRSAIGRVSFARYLASREYYDRLAQKRLRDWTDNKRLALGRLVIHLN